MGRGRARLLPVQRDRHVDGLGRGRSPGPDPHERTRPGARPVRRRSRAARHLRPHPVGRPRRPCRGASAGRPARRRHGPAPGAAQRACGRRGARPGRRRHPRGRHPAATERLDGGPHVDGRRAALAGRRVHVVAGVPALPGVGSGRPAGRAADAPAPLRAQGRRGDGLDRPRRGHGGGSRGSRRPAHQPRPALRPPPVHRAGRSGAPPLRRRGPPRGAHRATHRHAAPRRPRRHRPGRRAARPRRPALHRLAGDPVPGHHHVRRPGRPAGAPPARPAGRPGRGDPAPRADGVRLRARGRRRAARRSARRSASSTCTSPTSTAPSPWPTSP